LTCSGVSFAHGSNDGQKGMGLIMLILIGTMPTAYALNRAMPDTQLAEFGNTSAAAAEVIERKSAGFTIPGGNPRPAVTAYVSERRISEATYPALAGLVKKPWAIPATTCISPPRRSASCSRTRRTT
jgi:PiT family inorganic phosphate transporter